MHIRRGRNCTDLSQSFSAFQESRPQNLNLAEVPIDIIKTLENELDELVLKRATYVAEEEKRTINKEKDRIG